MPELKEELKEELYLYTEMSIMVRHHMHSLAADRKVSDIELKSEAREMAGILALYATRILITEVDPVMMPVYAFMCEGLRSDILSTMAD